jgi:type IV pilus biogenesis protein PilP
MRNNLKYLVLLAGFACLDATSAETASEKLTKIETETLLLKAREKQLDVKASIIAKQNEIVTKQQQGEKLTQTAVVGDPMIRSIEGIGKKMYATLQLANGNVVDAQIGDSLPNGMVVLSIKANEVIVENSKKHRVRLAPVPRAAPDYNAAYQIGSTAAMPPLPVLIRRGAGQ